MLPDTSIWSRYWQSDRIASCFDGAGARNYDACITDGWRRFFLDLPKGCAVLDLCTGNGAVALVAAETGRAAGKDFDIVAVDQAEIDPAFYVTRCGADLATIRFHGGTAIETLPFPEARFGAVISQYGIEYSDLDRSLEEAVRVLAPGGALRLVVHAAEGRVAAAARTVIAEADLLLDEIDLTGCASRCFSAVALAERKPNADAEENRSADRALAAFQQALMRSARQVAVAADATMFRNSGAVLLDTYQRRAHFSLDALLAKAVTIETEIRAHRGRLAALVAAALDAAAAEALAERLRAAGVAPSGSAPLMDRDGLIGHVVQAGFP
jgi:SAM-dependent methyltransferase